MPQTSPKFDAAVKRVLAVAISSLDDADFVVPNQALEWEETYGHDFHDEADDATSDETEDAIKTLIEAYTHV